MDAPPSVPAVVAVVVTCDPGWWLEETLSALAGQDYPNLAVLVVDAASAEDPTRRVASVLPSAYVRKATSRTGFAAAANEALGVVEGASHFLFCHDDVAPAPDAVRLLVEEAFRSNAGVVTPKFVEWDAADRLLAVGATTDRAGVVIPFVERGELDQEQHDAVRDVFVAPAGCQLVRADLFATLGGYDARLGVAGEDLDLSWRAQVAGARVVVAPSARVRHLEATATGLRGVNGSPPAPSPPAASGHEQAPRWTARRLRPVATAVEREHEALEVVREAARIRTVLGDYGPLRRVLVAPRMVLTSIVEALAALLTGEPRKARHVAAAWRRGLRRVPSEAIPRRPRLTEIRSVPDSEVHQLQVGGNARLRAVLRGASASAADPLRSSSLDLATSWREGLRLTGPVWVAVAVVLLFGTRHLLGTRLAAYGEIVPFRSPASMWAAATSGWRTTGIGSASPAPPSFFVLAAGGAVLLGHVALLQRILVLGLVPAGAVGAFHLARPIGSRRARLVAGVLYVANPLPYDALARGHWSGLVTYAVMPWVLLAWARASSLPPFGTATPDPAARAVRLALVLGVAGAFVPSAVPLAVVVAVALAVGCVVSGGVREAARSVAVVFAAGLGAAVLVFPWLPALAGGGGRWDLLVGAQPVPRGAVTLGQLLRFQTGPIGASPFGWALLAVAALPLVVGSGWRFAWATRLWVLALTSFGLAWAGGRGWLPVAVPPSEVLLVPAALALALAAGLGLTAFEVDLRGYHFGWRQLVSTLAAASAVVAVLPVLGGAFDGGWHAPSAGAETSLSWLADKRGDGDFRVLWLGDPAVLPVAGWRLDGSTAYATSENGIPDVTTSWPGRPSGATPLLASAVRLAEGGRTTELGHLLAPLAVRYLVVVDRSAPAGQPAVLRPAPPTLKAALESQVDLRRIDSDPSLIVYENAAFAPERSLLTPAAASVASGGALAARSVALTDQPEVLRTQRGPTAFSGPVAPGRVLVSESASPRWRLDVAGRATPRSDAFGSLNAFDVTGDGGAHLHYAGSVLRGLALVIEGLLWVLTTAWLQRRSPRAAKRKQRKAATPGTATSVEARRCEPAAATGAP